ncbi:unnamed protein product [Ilex paraguariensis]|uniref:Uncharacterized protein n=1 Tax=Ilex paraguariensis TaxID=185542 RepID=A0ABC8SNX1_9AQUA
MDPVTAQEETAAADSIQQPPIQCRDQLAYGVELSTPQRGNHSHGVRVQSRG